VTWNWVWKRAKYRHGNVSPLRGAPPRPRTKTYSAQTGYVYQYAYKGFRSFETGTEFVFEVTQNRTSPLTVTVALQQTALSECAASIGREILSAERYAIAKMTLFAAFDRTEDPKDFEKPLVPDAQSMIEHLRTLGRI